MSKKPKKLRDPEKVKQIEKVVVDFSVITIVFVIAIFTSRIPGLKGTEAADLIARTLGKFFDVFTIIAENYIPILESITILLFVWVLDRIAYYAINLFISKKSSGAAMGLLLRSFVKYSVGLLGIFFILIAWGVNPTAIAASLGLLGLALSFGAQGVLEDGISGLFLIFEHQFDVGDIVYIDGFRGRVHEIGIRTTKFLEPNTLDVKIMKNSDVKNIINASTKLSVAVCDMSIEYGEDLRKIEKITMEYLPQIMHDYPDMITECPVYLGVQSLADSAVILRVIAKTTEEYKLQVQRILNRELKLLFDREGINIPFPQIVLHNE